MTSGKVSLKTVIVMTILALVGVLSFLGMGAAKTYLSGASAGSEPKSVLATPSEDGKSVSISWQTDKPVQAVVEYGTTPASLLLRSLETDSTASHKLSISPLKPSTSYYFRIRVGEEVYDNSGIPFSFKTKGATGAGGGVPAGTPAVMPTTANKPTAVMTPGVTTPAPTVAGTCNRTTDYNGDGVVNSIDFIKCANSKPGEQPSVSPTKVTTKPTGSVSPSPAVTGTSTCRFDVDYDKNGVVNSIDRIKCLQSK